MPDGPIGRTRMLASDSAGASKSASVLILQMGALIFAAEGLIMLVMNGSHPDSAALLEALTAPPGPMGAFATT